MLSRENKVHLWTNHPSYNLQGNRGNESKPGYWLNDSDNSQPFSVLFYAIAPLPIIEKYYNSKVFSLCLSDGLCVTSLAESFLGIHGGNKKPFQSSNNCLVSLVEIKSIWHVCFCFSECGGHIITDSSDTISSPLFPDKYPNNQNCTWILEAQPPCK